MIKKVALQESVNGAQELREEILKVTLTSLPPSTTALAFIKEEVKSFM